ncbi:MAG: hypothetical protein ACYC5O_04095, partial [Anaerolineae bacterium]
RPADCGSLTGGLVMPVAEYGRSLGYSVAGGFVYRGSQSPALTGVYLYADYGSGRIWGLRRQGSAWETAVLLDTTYSIASFGEGEAGEVYVANRGGAVYHLQGPAQASAVYRIYLPLAYIIG